MSGTDYDVVIVGAGPAGCVLASRLSADPGRRILLLEAGPADRHPFIHMPKGIGKIMGDPGHIWAFQAKTRPGDNVPPAFWVRGRTLGGSSSINGLMYVRGQPQDFDALADETSEDWDWAHIGAAYKAIEDHELGDAATRGTGGPLRITMPDYRDRYQSALLETAETLGLACKDDVNAPDDQARIGYAPRTISGGRRQSAAVAFLRAAEHRPNLDIVTGAEADRVLFDGTAVAGIRCRVAGEHRDYSSKRVILCGGTFGSPVLLQRSGVGPAALLAQHDIACVADREQVGENLREHSALSMQWRLRGVPGQNREYSGWRLARNVLRYFAFKSGPMAGATFEIGGWFKSRPELDRPDIQFLAAPFSVDYSQAEMAIEAEPGVNCVVYPLRPKSRGRIQIAGSDIDTLPDISLDHLEAAEDREELLAGVRFMRRLFSTPPLADYIEGETRPGPAYESDEEIFDAIRTFGGPGYHACGTCRMGKDEASVVDPMTRVRGVTGLHVVDLSIAPQIPAGNTYGPVVAMAWRAAELIERAA